MQFTIELNYNASIIEVVEAEDEGQALDKARSLAEEADLNEYAIGTEQDARILNRQD